MTENEGIKLGKGGIGMSDIAQSAYKAIEGVGLAREAIMDQVKKAAAGDNGKKEIATGFSAISKIASGITYTTAGDKVDISTGAGALVLDDALQELSTLEQAAAQLVAAENKAQKQVHSVTGQG